jgi:ABC-type lipoprotein release transport system permease subunit
MFLLLKLAWRNIFRNTRRTILTGLAMMAGFVLSSVDLSILEGTFGDSVKAYTLAGAGQVQIHALGYLDKPTLFENFANAVAVGRVLDRMPQVQAWTPRLYAPALAFIGARTTSTRIVGVDPVREPQATRLLAGLKAGRSLAPGAGREAVIGGALADNLGAKPGDSLVLIAQAADGSIANDLFTIVGVKKSGGFSGHDCYLPLPAAQEFLCLPGRCHELTVTLRDYRQSRSAARAIVAAVHDPALEILPWEEVDKQFYHFVQVKKQGNSVVLLILYVIICLGVVNTVTMSLLERTREFGVLKALGTRPVSLLTMIQLEVGLLALLSIAAGTPLSLWLDTLLATQGILYPQPIEYGGGEPGRDPDAGTADADQRGDRKPAGGLARGPAATGAGAEAGVKRCYSDVGAFN